MDSLSHMLTKAEFKGKIQDFQIGDGTLSINQLQLADITILLSNFEDDPPSKTFFFFSDRGN